MGREGVWRYAPTADRSRRGLPSEVPAYGEGSRGPGAHRTMCSETTLDALHDLDRTGLLVGGDGPIAIRVADLPEMVAMRLRAPGGVVVFPKLVERVHGGIARMVGDAGDAQAPQLAHVVESEQGDIVGDRQPPVAHDGRVRLDRRIRRGAQHRGRGRRARAAPH